MSWHEFILGSSFEADGITAECSCGWESRKTFDSDLSAREAWDDHCDVVFMEATQRTHNYQAGA